MTTLMIVVSKMTANAPTIRVKVKRRTARSTRPTSAGTNGVLALSSAAIVLLKVGRLSYGHPKPLE